MQVASFFLHVISYLEIKGNLNFSDAVNEIQQECERRNALSKVLNWLPNMFPNKVAFKPQNFQTFWAEAHSQTRVGNQTREQLKKGMQYNRKQQGSKPVSLISKTQIACHNCSGLWHITAQCLSPRRDFKANDPKKHYEKMFRYKIYCFLMNKIMKF